MVNLYYEGTDMTDYVNVTKCVCRDVSHGRADSMELEFDHAAAWYQWGPKEDDKIIAEMDGYTTGTMYLNAIIPDGDKFRMLATALPSVARRKAWDAYRNMTLEKIMRQCAAEAGMSINFYGVDIGFQYAYLMRENEGAAAFMDWLGTLEGLAVKAYKEAFRAVSITYAQNLDPVQDFYLDTTQDGIKHMRKEIQKISRLTVLSPYARVAASDSGATYGSPRTVNLPATNVVQAGRWARGLLLAHNRQMETLTIRSSFNPKMEALRRVEVEGKTDANGSWIVDEAQHDLVNLKTETKLLRVISTIY